MNIYQSKGFIKTNEAEIKDAYVLWLSGLRHTHDNHTILSQSDLYTLTVEFINSSSTDLIVRYYYDDNLLNKPVQVMHFTPEGFEVLSKYT